MEPDVIYTVVFAGVDAELLGEVGGLDFYVLGVFEAVSGEVVCLFFFVVLVVWGY